jgi:hypothetical protein
MSIECVNKPLGRMRTNMVVKVKTPKKMVAKVKVMTLTKLLVRAKNKKNRNFKKSLKRKRIRTLSAFLKNFSKLRKKDPLIWVKRPNAI